jgi:subtilisin family serine protease
MIRLGRVSQKHIRWCTADAAAAVFGVLLAASVAQAQVNEPADAGGEVRLRTGTVRLLPGIAPGVAALWTQPAAATADREPPRLILDFENLPDAGLRERLAAQGIRLGDSLGGNAYVATIDNEGISTLEAVAENRAQLPELRAAAPILPEYKQEESVRRRTIGNWAVREDGTVLLRVEVWRDADFDNAADAVRALAQEITERAPAFDWMAVRVRPEQIDAVTRLNGVSWVEPVPPPIQKLNDQSRSQAFVDMVQAAPYNLSGQGINVAIWDGGAVAAAHADFQGRLTIVDPVGADSHATHVAGTAAGSGVRSQASGGAANQWRGMATQAQILSWDYQGTVPNEYLNGIQNLTIHLANNSWGHVIGSGNGNCDRYGDYDGHARDFDRIVHGDIGGRAIPVVFAAGNERDDGDCGMSGGPAFNNYSVIPTPQTAKNVITVGAINSNDLTMTDFSSWGPVDDGRLKPEVVAPGCQVGGDNGITSTNLTNGYGMMCGTSMAAPAVSGTVALLLQHYQATYGTMPVPAAIKALLVHTARDLGRPGPDYAFGYGLIDAQRAVDAIRTRQISEGNLESDGQIDIVQLNVPAGTPEIRVTLAWDDQAAASWAPQTLVNDLDLRLVAPSGQAHQPFVLNPAMPASDPDHGTDNINVVEQVLVAGPEPGLWQVEVRGTRLAQGPQRYALVWTPVQGVSTLSWLLMFLE